MRIYLFTLTTFISLTCFCQEKDLKEIRSCFKTAEGVYEIKKLINMTKNHLDHPVILAYNFTGKLMLLDYSSNRFAQYRNFKIKTKQLDSIVSANPKKIEIRLLRYAVQKNCPYFLRNNEDIRNDLNFIVSNLYKENQNLQLFIKALLNQFNNERSRNSS